LDPQLTTLIVPVEELEAIKSCLSAIREDIDATCIMLLDHSGQVLASRSRKTEAEETTIGALLAGTFSSSRELARILREQEFKSLIQQGPRESIYAELIGNQWILAIVFSKYSILGMVKVAAKYAVVKLEAILERVRLNSRERDRHLSLRMRDSLDDTLDILFTDVDNNLQAEAS
jgi:predicted regulator of Ras-like GTPase activity (Roadblock/LC7/MglB family)